MNKILITKTKGNKKYDLEERTYLFAKNVALFCNKLSKTTVNIKYIKQLIISSGSTGANYIEANEALSRKDFLMRVKICRKEAKESTYWLRLVIDTNADSFQNEGLALEKESVELKKIFSSIIGKSS